VTGPSTSGFWSLSTNEGFFLHFCETGVLAVPASWKDSVKIGVLAALHQQHSAQGLLGAALPSSSVTAITDNGDKRWLRFPLDQIDRIECRRSRFWRHKIVIYMLNGDKTAFGLFIREDFKLIAGTLHVMYADRVTEH
jgi:hypothetical protein